jgi:hypothetical protein
VNAFWIRSYPSQNNDTVFKQESASKATLSVDSYQDENACDYVESNEGALCTAFHTRWMQKVWCDAWRSMLGRATKDLLTRRTNFGGDRAHGCLRPRLDSGDVVSASGREQDCLSSEMCLSSEGNVELLINVISSDAG